MSPFSLPDRAVRSLLGPGHSGPPLIFLHLPKTAGTTFSHVARRHIPAGVSHLVRVGIDPAKRAEFAALPEAFRMSLKLVRGHQAFGLHEHLAPGARYVAFVRDPVDRVVSHYHYVKKARLPQFEAVTRLGLTLEQYAAGGITDEVENAQTRWLAGVWSTRPLTEADLQQALRNIDSHFDCVGLTERFDEALVEVAVRYRWTRIAYRRVNVGSADSRTPVSDEARRIIEQRNALDRRLYELVAQRNRDRNVLHRLGRSLGARALRVANRFVRE